jgi:hypothetical protein
MTEERPTTPDLMKATPLANRNPYIMNFCKALVEKKGETHEPEALKKLLNDMYRLYENLLGQNMVQALPDNLRKEYLELSKDLNELSYAKIGEIFDKNITNREEIMKQTMREFTEIFMRNRTFDPKEYPVSADYDGSTSRT